MDLPEYSGRPLLPFHTQNSHPGDVTGIVPMYRGKEVGLKLSCVSIGKKNLLFIVRDILMIPLSGVSDYKIL